MSDVPSPGAGPRPGGAPPGGLEVVVNGEHRVYPPGATVASVIAELLASPKGCAVARNETLVPRSAWDATPLVPGDRLEILSAAAGG